MQGVTTALVAFILLALAWPRLIRNRPQFYGAALAVGLIIALDALATIFSSSVVISMSDTGHVQTITHGALYNFAYFFIALLQLVAFVLLLLSAGGQSVRELGSDFGKTIDVIRRGGEKETLIIPRTGETPRPRASEDAPSPRINISSDEEGTIPLE